MMKHTIGFIFSLALIGSAHAQAPTVTQVPQSLQTSTCTSVQLLYGGGSALPSQCLNLGSNLSITSGTLNASGGSSGLTIGSTAISGGTSGFFLYQSGGVLQSLATTGTAGTVVLSNGTPVINALTINNALTTNITGGGTQCVQASNAGLLSGTGSACGGGGGSGTVTTVSVVSANGFAGTVANPTTTPAITLTTSVTGLLKGNATAISAATSCTDYQPAVTLTTTGSSGVATFNCSTGALNIPNYASGGGSGTVSSGSVGQVPYYAATGTTISGTTGFLYDGVSQISLGNSGANSGIIRLISVTGGNSSLSLASTATVGFNLTLPAVTDTLTANAATQTLTNKTISGASNTLTNIGNSSLTNSAIPINGTTCTLGTACTVTAAAGTLTGTTLNPTVVSSSLTSVGTIGTGVWQGTNVGLSFGGTNASLTASNGGIVYSSGSALAILAGTATANQCLLSGSSAAPSWGSCATGSVTSVTNSDGTLTISPTTGAVVASLALGHTNTWTATQTLSGSASTFALSLLNGFEPSTVSATAATGTINLYSGSQSITYYTSNASANWTVNLAFASGTTMNSALPVGGVTTVVFYATQGSTAFFNSAVQVDGTTSGVTTKWQGGAPSVGNASGIDVYTYSVTKTASATYTILASQTQFK